MSEWKKGTAKELIADLRPGGNVFGNSERFPGRHITLQKTDFIADLRKLPADHVCIWQVINPHATGFHEHPRRAVIIYLGK